ncbi:hypothetical protein [Leisingera sp. M658]|uniref:hypothetical protein n=1 Tax=Leisingera sp. M658 TaxID=2867015 RepID=UPI0021A6DC5E|nr:hypothetical protein [Leisingera sp. M658]UWQ73663.1 hypothetical protein K3724_14025 [Leisingera sp. M658]
MYTSILRAAALIIPLSFAAQPVFAQTADAALNEAKRRVACGAGVPVSATYLANGTLQVTCQAQGAEAVAQAAASGLPETGLSAGAAAGAVAGVLFLVLIADDDNGTSTTTTTTTTSTTD